MPLVYHAPTRPGRRHPAAPCTGDAARYGDTAAAAPTAPLARPEPPPAAGMPLPAAPLARPEPSPAAGMPSPAAPT